MRGWGVSEVADWVVKILGLAPRHADILVKNEILGADLLDRVTETSLVSVGMPLGPAGRIMSAVRTSSMGTGKFHRGNLGPSVDGGGSSNAPFTHFFWPVSAVTHLQEGEETAAVHASCTTEGL